MKPFQTGLCTVLFFFSLVVYAQTPGPTPPQAWQCQADCFGIEGNDGTTLRYWGGVRTGLFYQQGQAFQKLKDACGLNGLVVVRKLKGTFTQTQTQDVIEHDGEQTVRTTWYGLQIVRSSDRTRRYRVVDREFRGIFDVIEATPENACTPQSIYVNPIWNTRDGDPIRG